MKPIIYTTEDFYYRYKLGNLNDYYLWLRNMRKKPSSDSTLEWVIRQYKIDKIPGITDDVDFNLMRSEIDQMPRVKSKVDDE